MIRHTKLVGRTTC